LGGPLRRSEQEQAKARGQKKSFISFFNSPCHETPKKRDKNIDEK
jgi:hypothetical protein